MSGKPDNGNAKTYRQVYLSRDDGERLDKLREAENRSISGQLRQLLDEAAERRGCKPDFSDYSGATSNGV
jgi:hypothetical protein